MVTSAEIEQLVDFEGGLVSPTVFSDKELYRLEQQRVFGRCWLFVGHESMVPNKNDYMQSYMGEDSVIVCRDSAGKVRVLLNRCRHRANRVCLYDKGNTPVFTCSFHGWSYNTEGELVGVPFFEEAYAGQLDKKSWGLVEAKVGTIGGLIFAAWDPFISLDEYIGEARWYLETFLCVEWLGGLEIVPGKQRYMIPGNWKISAENFAGDHYHHPSTHASYMKVMRESPNFPRLGGVASRRGFRSERFEVTLGFRSGVPIGLGSFAFDIYEDDLARAEELGPEAVEWVTERHRRLQEHLQKEGRFKHTEATPYSFQRGNVFPHFSLVGVLNAVDGRGLLLWHPRGPNETEAWEWCAVEREAPKVVKEPCRCRSRSVSGSSCWGCRR